MVVLGIETTCDETAAAVVERGDDGRGAILSNVILSQVGEHAALAASCPRSPPAPMSRRSTASSPGALARGRLRLRPISTRIAATAGPGLIGGVIVGLTTAKAIALAAGKPLIAVNHLEAHALTARLTDGLAFPYLPAARLRRPYPAPRRRGRRRLSPHRHDHRRCARRGLRQGGEAARPALSRRPASRDSEAARGDAARFALPRPMHRPAGADFSLSGLKTALRLEAEKIAPLTDQDVADLCASFQAAVVEVVARPAARRLASVPAPDTALRPRSSSPAASRPTRRSARRCTRRARGRHRAGRAAARALQRQRRHDRLGRRGAAGARPHRRARRAAARALAARRSRCGRGAN